MIVRDVANLEQMTYGVVIHEERFKFAGPFGIFGHGRPYPSAVMPKGEPHRYPELSALRSVLLGWRFYHQFRTDFESPLRRPQTGVRTPVLSHDGTDLAAALQTIFEMGDSDALKAAISEAFSGGSVLVE